MSTIDVDITEPMGENQSMAGVHKLGRALCILNSPLYTPQSHDMLPNLSPTKDFKLVDEAPLSNAH